MTQTDLWCHTTRLAPKPIDTQFYADLIAKAADWIPRSTQVLSDLRGLACEVRSGEVLQLQLLDGAQIVHLFMFNPEDPDERFWAQTSFATEGLFLSRYSRLWGTMARNRPMLTMLADTVTPPRRADWVYGSHHPICSGTGAADSLALRRWTDRHPHPMGADGGLGGDARPRSAPDSG